MIDAKIWSVDHVSPHLDPDAIKLAVVIPTYKRPEHLCRTLASVARQSPGCPFVAVVVENHAAGLEGARVVHAMFEAGEAHGLLVVEPRQGNCNAYNAGFGAALAAFPALEHIAIIDDDEVAEPDWLSWLLSASVQGGGADIVGGPQKPLFDDGEGARRYASHPVFRPTHHRSGAAGLITSTGNCLIAARVLREMSPDWLDPRFNFLGGGDTDFFTRCRERGFRFRWAADAVVVETVPARRTERSWITARSLRNGLISALIQRKHNPGVAGRFKVLAKSLALLVASPFRTLALWRETGSAYAGSYHMMIAAGRLLAEFGYRIEQYRHPEKN
ncbi:MAG: glycosyltransferase family 2 protein [Beijerinckiaceae bacterium]